MNNLPATIIKTEQTRYDEYTGPLVDLIAAGLVRRDQLPPEGKLSISWRNGVLQRRRCTQDEHYLRVVIHEGGTATVQVGLSAEVAAPRRQAAALEKRKAETERLNDWAAAEAKRKYAECAEQARLARLRLNGLIRSEGQYRSVLVKRMRSLLNAFLEHTAAISMDHAFSLTPDGVDEVKEAFQTLKEAILEAEVDFDGDRHAGLVQGLKATIRAADPDFYAQFDKLVQPNPSLIEGEKA